MSKVVDVLRRGLGFDSPEKEAAQLRTDLERKYRKVFTSPEGRVVFRSMLEDLCFFDEVETDEDKARRNYATLLLYRLGYRDTGDLTNQILDTTPTEEKANG